MNMMILPRQARDKHRENSKKARFLEGETPLIPGQHGVQAWDLPGIGRIAILICFDVNFAELWHQVRNPIKLSTLYPDKAITAQPPCNRRNI